jgi:hypothetical protein
LFKSFSASSIFFLAIHWTFFLSEVILKHFLYSFFSDFVSTCPNHRNPPLVISEIISGARYRSFSSWLVFILIGVYLDWCVSWLVCILIGVYLDWCVSWLVCILICVYLDWCVSWLVCIFHTPFFFYCAKCVSQYFFLTIVLIFALALKYTTEIIRQTSNRMKPFVCWHLGQQILWQRFSESLQ